jgi:prepilin-type N-terminal cleavage/methylation domain-containing protein
MSRNHRRGFTLVEMMLVLGLVGVVGLGLLMFTFASSRFVARNLATNHSHEATRLSSQTLLKELHEAASAFELINAAATTFAEVSAATTSEVDKLTSQNVSTRTNGVRFRQLVAGPIALTANTTPEDLTLTFNFSGGTYVPMVGDRLTLPLIAREYGITSVSGNTVGIHEKLGFTLNTASPNIVTGYFYRKVALTVFNNELRYHDAINFPNLGSSRVVRGGVTSPKPFSVFFPDATGTQSDKSELRVSMEFTDLDYSARRFGNGTTTLYTVFPPRTVPVPIRTQN